MSSKPMANTRPLIEQFLSCPRCGCDMDYVGVGEWDCECGHVELADHLAGPDFAEWFLKQIDSDVVEVHPNLRRRIYSWHHETHAVDVYVADRFLTKFGLHLTDLPDRLWVEAAPRRNPRFTASTKRAAVQRVLAGEPQKVVAASIGASAKIVSRWKSELAA